MRSGENDPVRVSGDSLVGRICHVFCRYLLVMGQTYLSHVSHFSANSMPVSVMTPVMSSLGVMSKAGLKTSHSDGAMGSHW